MKEFVIYSCLVGQYDIIHQPSVIDERFDYILFTDNLSVKQNGVWQLRAIPYHDDNPTRESRYAKCLPHLVLQEYKASLYIDANISISTQFVYDRFFECYTEGIEWGGIKHPSQDCIYDEICAITDLRWVHDMSALSWYAYLRNMGFPDKWGLYENNVIFRRHTPIVAKTGDLWWNTLAKKGCLRDQFSLMFAIWQHLPRTGYFLPPNECPRLNSDNFSYYEHNPHNRVVHLGLFEKLRRALLIAIDGNIRVGYHNLFDQLCKHKSPEFMLFLWEIGASLKNGHKILNMKKTRY